MYARSLMSGDSMDEEGMVRTGRQSVNISLLYMIFQDMVLQILPVLTYLFIMTS